VFVLKDGGESDLDLGNYERFLNIQLTSEHNITTGKIYRQVILKERRGDYLGKTVQVVPHITNEIQEWMERVAKIPVDGSGQSADVCLIEVGGTVGDIESSVFLEALRQFQFRVGVENFCLSFVSLVPVLSEEQKTKPTQHGVKDLRSLGLSPAIIFCRSAQQLLEETKLKISNFCHVPPDNVLSVHDVNNIYQVPILLQEQGLHDILLNSLKLGKRTPDLGAWDEMARQLESFDKTVKIALIGKYTGLQDSYLSVIKALKHASIACRHLLDIVWVEATMLEKMDEDGNDKSHTAEYKDAWSKVEHSDGVIVPGGFGNRYVVMFVANECIADPCNRLNLTLLLLATSPSYHIAAFWERVWRPSIVVRTKSLIWAFVLAFKPWWWSILAMYWDGRARIRLNLTMNRRIRSLSLCPRLTRRPWVGPCDLELVSPSLRTLMRTVTCQHYKSCMVRRMK
jgi:CTP synthase